MNERIKTLRKHLKISQDVFGRRIGITGASVSRIESGENEPSPQTIAFICKEFDVNESWLRDGVGDMFRATSGEAERLVKKYSFPDIVGKLLTVYEGLNDAQQEAVLEYAQRFVASLIDGDSIESKVESYRKELLAEKEAAILSASQTSNDETA